MRDVSAIPPRVHIIGAGGAGMSGLAKILSQLGHVVSGSDLKPGRMLDSLRDVGVTTWIGHRPVAMADVDLVVCSSAMASGDPEILEAEGRGVPVWRRPALLSALTAATPAIGLAGTLLGVIGGVLLGWNVESIVGHIEHIFGVHFLDPSIYYISALPSDVRAGDVIRIGRRRLPDVGARHAVSGLARIAHRPGGGPAL